MAVHVNVSDVLFVINVLFPPAPTGFFGKDLELSCVCSRDVSYVCLSEPLSKYYRFFIPNWVYDVIAEGNI